MNALRAAISSDIDTLASIYKGFGCRRPAGYTYAELRMGLENFDRFLEPYGIRATLFMVGNDFKQPSNHAAIRAMAARGHEIANHTMTHPQGFRQLTPEEKEAEIAGMEEICEQVTGSRPKGFRSPGWNINDEALPILRSRDYLYDSSVFPSSLMPLFKAAHWYTMRSRRGGERTTMGDWKYMLAPTVPYRTGASCLSRPGEGGVMEIPITMCPGLRLPFFATFLLLTGLAAFRTMYEALRFLKRPIHFQFHLSDFVDYTSGDLADEVPPAGNGLYVPLALQMPLKKKMDLFRPVLDMIAADYSFCTLREWSRDTDH